VWLAHSRSLRISGDAARGLTPRFLACRPCGTRYRLIDPRTYVLGKKQQVPRRYSLRNDKGSGTAERTDGRNGAACDPLRASWVALPFAKPADARLTPRARQRIPDSPAVGLCGWSGVAPPPRPLLPPSGDWPDPFPLHTLNLGWGLAHPFPLHTLNLGCPFLALLARVGILTSKTKGRRNHRPPFLPDT
jgi:hypothetical protein